MTEAVFDLRALADAVLARRSRVHAPKGDEHVNVPAPSAEDFEERAAVAEVDAGVPREWAEGFARLQVTKPPASVSAQRWRQVIDDAGCFIDRWGAQAAALGWRTVDVFGVHADKPEGRFDAAGLVWCLRGARVVAITEESARLTTTTGASLTFHRSRHHHPEAVAAWVLLGAPENSGAEARHGTVPEGA